MLFAASNLLQEGVIVISQKPNTFSIYVFSQIDIHFTHIYSSQVTGTELILDLSVAEVSEDAKRFLVLIVTTRCFYVICGQSNGSIIFEKTIEHQIKKPAFNSIFAKFIPRNRQIVCFHDEDIFLFNPYDDHITLIQSSLKIDSTKQYRPYQADKYQLQQVLTSLNYEPNLFILEKSCISSFYSLKCCEVDSDSSSVIIWWEADVISSHSVLSVARTSIFNDDDAILLAVDGGEVRVYTLDGLLCRIDLAAGLGDMTDDAITAIQCNNAPVMPSTQCAPFIGRVNFLISTFQKGLFLCSATLPSEETSHALPVIATNISVRQLHISCANFSYHSPSFPSQVLADEATSFCAGEGGCSLLPYFETIFPLQLSVNLRDPPSLSSHQAGATRRLPSTDECEGFLLVANSNFASEIIRVSLSPSAVEDVKAGATPRSSGGGCMMTSGVFGLFSSLSRADQVLSLCEDSDNNTDVFLQYSTDNNYPVKDDSKQDAPRSVGLTPLTQNSSMLYRVERGVPLLSDGGNTHPLDIPLSAQPVTIFTVVSDIPLDIIPITQRSYSSHWSTVVLMSSPSCGESSLFTVNHAGKFQAVMDRTDVIMTEATLSFFRIREQLVIQVTKSTINLLQIRNFRNINMDATKSIASSSTLSVAALSLPEGSSIQHVGSHASLWTQGDGSERRGPSLSSNQSFHQSYFNSSKSIFAVSSKRKFLLIQIDENGSKKSKDKLSTPARGHLKEVFGHAMSSDVYCLAVSEDTTGSDRENESKVAVAVTLWDSRRSIQVFSILVANGACCILSITSCSDLLLSPSLKDSYSKNPSQGALPFKFVHICPTLTSDSKRRHDTKKGKSTVDEHVRCYVVGGCVDGHVVMFELEYLEDSCTWKEQNQWSSFVRGGVQGISLLNFYQKDRYDFELACSLSKKSVSCSKNTDGSGHNSARNVIFASAFLVNGETNDFVYKFALSMDLENPSVIHSSWMRTRSIRQGRHRSHICSVHPFHVPQSSLGVAQSDSRSKSCGDNSGDSISIYVDNFLWLMRKEEKSRDTSNGSGGYLSLCVGSRSIYHDTPKEVNIPTASKRLCFRILRTVYLNNHTSASSGGSSHDDRASYILIMYSTWQKCEKLREGLVSKVGVMILECETMSCVWDYEPEGNNDTGLHGDVENIVLNIALAPHVSTIMQRSFVIMHSYLNRKLSARANKVICSLFCVVDGDRKGSVEVNRLHSAQLESISIENECKVPFLAQPVGLEHLAVASDSCLTVLGWECQELKTARVFSLREVASAPYAVQRDDRVIVSHLSSRRHFENNTLSSSCTVNCFDKISSSTKKSDPKKMKILPPDLCSSSDLSFDIFVALAYVGIEIFHFSYKDGKLERTCRISTEDCFVSDVVHNVAAASLLPVRLRAQGLNVANSEHFVGIGSIDKEKVCELDSVNKIKGFFLCFDGRGGYIMFYEEQNWVKQSMHLEDGLFPICILPHNRYLLTNARKSSDLACQSMKSNEYSIITTSGELIVYDLYLSYTYGAFSFNNFVNF